MPDIYDRKPQKVFGVRFRRNNIIIIRHELCMHARLLAQSYDMLQFIIFVQPQRNDNLIQTVFRQDHHQIVDPSDHLNILISRSPRHIIIQNTPNQITPLGILFDPVNIFLRRAAVTYQQNVFQIHSVLTDLHQKHADQIPDQRLQNDIDSVKQKHHVS